MSKKIGILTFHNSNNFGAILQTIALQEVLSSMSHEVEIIDYIEPHKADLYKSFHFSRKKGVIYNIKRVFRVPNNIPLFIKNTKLQSFKNKNYKISNTSFFGPSDNLKKYADSFDIISTGSDQVWNYHNTNFSKTYFLDFVSHTTKKISYAASFGIENIEDQYKNKLKELLLKLDSISVREKAGKKIIADLISNENIEINVNLDPTLLLSQENWEKYTLKKTDKKKFVLIYSLNKYEGINEIAKYVSELLGIEVVSIFTNWRDYLTGFRIINPGIEEFLKLFRDADFVVTDSFHGLAFSINFNKNFYIYLEKDKKTNVRLQELLKLFNLEERQINSKEECTELSIDFKPINQILDEKRIESINYLKDCTKS